MKDKADGVIKISHIITMLIVGGTALRYFYTDVILVHDSLKDIIFILVKNIFIYGVLFGIIYMFMIMYMIAFIYSSVEITIFVINKISNRENKNKFIIIPVGIVCGQLIGFYSGYSQSGLFEAILKSYVMAIAGYIFSGLAKCIIDRRKYLKENNKNV